MTTTTHKLFCGYSFEVKTGVTKGNKVVLINLPYDFPSIEIKPNKTIELAVAVESLKELRKILTQILKEVSK